MATPARTRASLAQMMGYEDEKKLKAYFKGILASMVANTGCNVRTAKAQILIKHGDLLVSKGLVKTESERDEAVEYLRRLIQNI